MRAIGPVLTVLCSLLISANASEVRKDSLPGKFGYVEVREGAHTFWWKFDKRAHTESDEANSHSRPLILWLQGGPGASGVGFGNFEEVGPYEIGWKPRKHSWIEEADLLFVDSPVGTGFSYVTSNDSLARNNKQIAEDLVEFVRQYVEQEQASEQPLYIFSESYGGKVCADFALHLQQAQQAGSIKVNLRGVAFGDSWISPIDYVFTWGDYLKAFSLLDPHQLSELAPLLLNTQAALEAGNLTQATDLWGVVEQRIGNLTEEVDWYNVLLHNIPDTEANSLWQVNKPGQSLGLQSGHRLLGRYHTDPLVKFMREEVTPALGIIPKNVTWASQASIVFEHLAGDFMTSVVSSVDKVLGSGLPVVIYNGQLDLICSTLGLNAWLPKLQWNGLADFTIAKPTAIYAKEGSRQPTGFHRQHDNLSLYIILRAGHMIPSDQPIAALDMVRRIVSSGSQSLHSDFVEA